MGSSATMGELCTIDGQFVLVVARDTTLPRLSLDSISLLGGSDAPCSAVDSNADFAIYQFPVTACGTRAMELGGYVVYENKMSSSYEVGVGPLGAITRDSHYELYFQCRYADATVAALAVQLASNNPPMPVAASGPLMVELRLGSGQCVTKGCMQAQAAYTSYYGDADYPVTKVLREPVYVEVRILGRTDPNIALVLGRCWATSSPDPFSIPQWELLVDGCPYQHDSYLTTPIPVDGSSGLQFPSHYKRFVLKMFTFVDHASMAPLQEKVFIHCSTSVCQLTAADSCEPRCSRQMTVQCTIDGQFVLVVARDTTLPRLSLDSISLLGGSDAPCSAVDSNADFAIYQFPVTACGTRAMELGGYVVYENKMSSSYEVGVGPLGAITRDSHYELYFQCRYADATVAALAVQLASNNPPMPVAASGPLMVELRLGSGQCVTKGCMQAQAAYTSYYGDADYPVTKVLREPVYVEVRILGRTDPNIALVLGRCWATSSPDPFSIPQWELLVDGCPYQHDSYLTTPIPVDGSSGLQFPSHYKRFVLKMFTFVDHASMAPLQEKVFIHCSTSVCQLTAADSCEPRCSRQRRDVVAAGRKSSHQLTVVSSGEVIFTEKAETVPPELQGNPNLVE
ncbi:hypothetical protein SRHO_G00071040 [Serrasalmus rhombeus]